MDTMVCQKRWPHSIALKVQGGKVGIYWKRVIDLSIFPGDFTVMWIWPGCVLSPGLTSLTSVPHKAHHSVLKTLLLGSVVSSYRQVFFLAIKDTAQILAIILVYHMSILFINLIGKKNVSLQFYFCISLMNEIILCFMAGCVYPSVKLCFDDYSHKLFGVFLLIF